MWKLLQVALCFISFTTQATLPKGCVIEEVKTEIIHLKGKQDRMFYVNNSHAYDVFLVDPYTRLTSKISPNQWSVLSLSDNEAIEFSCIESKPGAEQRISCINTVTICQISKAEIPKEIKSTQWLVENNSLENSNDILIIKHVG